MKSQLSQQAIDEMRERYLPEYFETREEELELVNLDILCVVKERESLEFVTLCLNSQLLKTYQSVE